MVRYPTWSVLLQTSSARFLVYIVDAPFADAAIDLAIRSALVERPNVSFRLKQATEVSLTSPMKIMDSTQ